MWWLMVQDLVRTLSLDPALDYAEVRVGQSMSVPDRSTVEVSRGAAGPDDLFNPGSGVVLLNVDCWEHSESDEWGDGYAALARLERHVVAALMDWQREYDPADLDGADMVVDEVSVQPDLDAFRPSVGSRLAVRINWQRSM